MSAGSLAPLGAGRLAADVGPMALLDMRTRLLAALMLVVLLACLRTPLALGVALLLAGAFALAVSPDRRRLMRRLLHLEGFLLVLFILLPFSVPGRVLFEVGPLAASAEGLVRAGEIGARLTAVALVLAALIGTADPAAVARAAARLGVPMRLAALGLATVRAIGLVGEEAERLFTALKLRGFRPRLRRHEISVLAALIGTLLVRAAARADRQDEALRLRGYAGQWPVLAEGRFTGGDAVAAGAVALVVLGLLVLERMT